MNNDIIIIIIIFYFSSGKYCDKVMIRKIEFKAVGILVRKTIHVNFF